MTATSLASADIVILILILLSALIGLVRGLIREVLSLFVWLAAFLLSVYFAAEVAVLLSPALGELGVRTVLGFILVFAGTLIVGGIVQWLVRKLVATSGLTGTDRVLGFVFGGARGVLVSIIALIVLRPFAEQAEWWRASRLAPELLAFEQDVLRLMGQAREAVVQLSIQK